MSSDQGSSNMLNRSNFAGSTTIVSSEFDQVKTDNYNHFESISEDEEEKIQMDNHHHGYYVTETGKPVLTSTYETTDNCLVDQQNYYNVTAANGRSRTSPTLYNGFNSNTNTTTTTTANTLHHETSYYDKKDDGYGSGLGELHQSGISEAHLVTHAD
jgi:hypothetical protein